jgi:hypothetical protein
MRIALARIAVERTASRTAMNILLWYLPFAMFSETCDLLMSECKTPPHGNRTEVRTRRPVALAAPGSDEEAFVGLRL